ncbi:DnaD domain-containing protein [Virgibacillus sp. CBA3643]|uniref:DnaD domain-containing protein n=1 Tax=Virgibacillus sp. CBA3643 TaxID=2942278 RepID=UPI0035A3C085
MNYIKEMNAFYNRIDFQPISSSSVALWHTLMHFNNRCSWKKEFSVAASMLQLKAGLKSTAFKTARHELQANGYITFQSRGSNRAAMYQMISQQMDFQQGDDSSQGFSSTVGSEIFTTAQDPVHKPNNILDHKADHTADPLIKQRHQQNSKKSKPAVTADAICFYQENFGVTTPFIAEDITGWITDLGESLVLHAMKLTLAQGKTTWRYVKGILNAWRQKGFKTVEEAENEEMEFRKRRPKKSGNSYQEQRNEIVPEWFLEQKYKKEHARQSIHPKAVPGPDKAKEVEEVGKMLAKMSTKKRVQSVTK